MEISFEKEPACEDTLTFQTNSIFGKALWVICIPTREIFDAYFMINDTIFVFRLQGHNERNARLPFSKRSFNSG